VAASVAQLSREQNPRVRAVVHQEPPRQVNHRLFVALPRCGAQFAATFGHGAQYVAWRFSRRAGRHGASHVTAVSGPSQFDVFVRHRAWTAQHVREQSGVRRALGSAVVRGRGNAPRSVPRPRAEPPRRGSLWDARPCSWASRTAMRVLLHRTSRAVPGDLVRRGGTPLPSRARWPFRSQRSSSRRGGSG